MTTKIKQKKLLEWNDLHLSPLDVTEARTEGRAFTKYNGSVRQVPEGHERPSLAASDNFYKGVDAKSVIASVHPQVRKARSRGRVSGWCSAHTVAVSPAEECFWNSSPKESTSTAADASRHLGWNKADSWAWWGKPKATQQLWIPQQRLSVSSEGIILSVLHAVRPAPPRQGSSATDYKVCTWTRGKLQAGTDLLSNLYTEGQVNLVIYVPKKRDFFRRDANNADSKHAGDLGAG